MDERPVDVVDALLVVILLAKCALPLVSEITSAVLQQCDVNHASIIVVKSHESLYVVKHLSFALLQLYLLLI
jgi:hypothetical protein